MSTLMIMAGGTGGHVYPALAVAHRLQAEGVDVFWLGTHQGIEARIVPENDIEMEWISIDGIKGRGVLAMLTAPFKIVYAMVQTAVVIFRRRPAAAIGMGGFVSGPGGMMTALLRVPLLIHESNAVVGLTNKWLAKISTRVLVGFPEVLAHNRNHQYVGNPVRESIAALYENGTKGDQQKERPMRLLIVGGSRGAQVLNEIVPAALATIEENHRAEILHQTGAGKLDTTLKLYESCGVEANCQEFIDDMAKAYTWADLVICRAGAMTVAEIAAAGIAAIFVPYPYAIYDHQTLNARFLSATNGALLISQDEFSIEKLALTLLKLDDDRDQILLLGNNARKLAKIDATASVARICKEVMHA